MISPQESLEMAFAADPTKMLGLPQQALADLLAEYPGLTEPLVDVRVADLLEAISEGSADLGLLDPERLALDFVETGAPFVLRLIVIDVRSGVRHDSGIKWDAADPFTDGLAWVSWAMHLVEMSLLEADHAAVLDIEGSVERGELAWSSAAFALPALWSRVGHGETADDHDVAGELTHAAEVVSLAVALEGIPYGRAIGAIAGQRPYVRSCFVAGRSSADVAAELAEHLDGGVAA
ncbi:hypothetical protein ASF30_01975 [Leifsonia sp. Leaf264]|nr:hypothetical protein ASF30_01975 [Leifsonia sp. Leaf264]